MHGVLVTELLHTAGLQDPGLGSSPAGPTGEAEVLERHRAGAVNLRGVLQPDMTKGGNLELVEETEELRNKESFRPPNAVWIQEDKSNLQA